MGFFTFKLIIVFNLLNKLSLPIGSCCIVKLRLYVKIFKRSCVLCSGLLVVLEDSPYVWLGASIVSLSIFGWQENSIAISN